LQQKFHREYCTLACTDRSSSKSSESFSSRASASRLGEEPKAGGGSILPTEKKIENRIRIAYYSY